MQCGKSFHTRVKAKSQKEKELSKMKTKLYLLTALLVLAALMCCPLVGATPYRMYDMKYEVIPTESVPATGHLDIAVFCGQNIFSKSITIQAIAAKSGAIPPAVTNGAMIDPSVPDYYDLSGDIKTVDLNTLGKGEIDLDPGLYLVTLPNGRIGAPEYAIVEITAGATIGAGFWGHAVSTTHDEPVCPNKITIKIATYGMQTVTHHAAVYKTVHHDAEYRYEIVWSGAFDGWCKEVHGYYTPYDFTIDGRKYKIVGDTHASKYKRIFVHGAYDEHVLITPAWDETVGTYIDVRDQVQSVVDAGNTMFVFDNSKNPGGIFNVDGTALLAEITDPAPNQMKTVSLTYDKGCGAADVTKDVAEYQTTIL